MKKLLYGFLCAMVVCGSAYAMDEELLPADTSDPLYLVADNHILSSTTIEYGDDILRMGQGFSYGLNERLSIGTNVHYQFDFNHHRKQRGFSSIELNGVYRAGSPEDNSQNISTDVLFGINFGGNRHVPDYGLKIIEPEHRYISNKTKYFAGVRIGRQWAGVSLAGTVKSTWVFDNTNGIALLDFIPEVYFRMVEGWRFGIAFDARLATNPDFDKEWLRFKLLRQFGRTQYIASYSYEYEESESMIGLQLNLLF